MMTNDIIMYTNVYKFCYLLLFITIVNCQLSIVNCRVFFMQSIVLNLDKILHLLFYYLLFICLSFCPIFEKDTGYVKHICILSMIMMITLNIYISDLTLLLKNDGRTVR